MRPRICWPCCSVQGDWRATRATAVRCAIASAEMTSQRSFANAEMRAAFSRYSGSRASKWPYSLTVTPHPLAVMTSASMAPLSTIGHHASMSARMSSRPASWRLRWKRMPPQQPAPGASRSDTPSRSRTRAAAALMPGARIGWTQPPSTSIFLPWRGVGHGPEARAFTGIFAFNARGKNGRHRRPSDRATAKRPVCGSNKNIAARRSRSHGARSVRSSTSARPMSTSLPYCTPEGQVVSQARHVRQRSRCSRVRAVTSAPSSARLIR